MLIASFSSNFMVRTTPTVRHARRSALSLRVSCELAPLDYQGVERGTDARKSGGQAARSLVYTRGVGIRETVWAWAGVSLVRSGTCRF